MSKTVKCLSIGCRRPALTRGLCNSCRVTARNEVAAGNVTDEELVSLGLMLPKHLKIRSPFRRGLDKARRAQD